MISDENISIFLVLHMLLVCTSFNRIWANFEKKKSFFGGYPLLELFPNESKCIKVSVFKNS